MSKLFNFFNKKRENKRVSPKTISIAFAVLVVVFAISYNVLATWTEPTALAPGGNRPTPLNVGHVGQSKTGGLTLNTGGAATGLIIDKGNVGIGTTTPGTPLEIKSTADAIFHLR